MAAVSQPSRKLTPEEFLAIEREAAGKSEFVDGEVYAMSGASPTHVRIATNLIVTLAGRLRGSPCEPFGSDLRVGVPGMQMISYPDITVVCGGLQLATDQKDVAINPVCIFEVLSPSTERWDRGEKFRRYQAIPTLKEYILVQQDQPIVERFVRDGDEWRLAIVTGLEANIAFKSLNIEVTLAEIFERVEFAQEEEPGLGEERIR